MLLGEGLPAAVIALADVSSVLLVLLELAIVYHLASIQPNRNHESPRRQVVEKFGVFSIGELVRQFDVVEVGSGHSAEVLLPDGLRSAVWPLLGISNDQLLEHRGQLAVVVGLAEQGVHQAGEVDLSTGEDGRLVVLVRVHEEVEPRVV